MGVKDYGNYPSLNTQHTSSPHSHICGTSDLSQKAARTLAQVQAPEKFMWAEDYFLSTSVLDQFSNSYILDSHWQTYKYMPLSNATSVKFTKSAIFAHTKRFVEGFFGSNLPGVKCPHSLLCRDHERCPRRPFVFLCTQQRPSSSVFAVNFLN